MTLPRVSFARIKKEWFEVARGTEICACLNAGADYLPLHVALEIRTLARLDSDRAASMPRYEGEKRSMDMPPVLAQSFS